MLSLFLLVILYNNFSLSGDRVRNVRCHSLTSLAYLGTPVMGVNASKVAPVLFTFLPTHVWVRVCACMWMRTSTPPCCLRTSVASSRVPTRWFSSPLTLFELCVGRSVAAGAVGWQDVRASAKDLCSLDTVFAVRFMQQKPFNFLLLSLPCPSVC